MMRIAVHYIDQTVRHMRCTDKATGNLTHPSTGWLEATMAGFVDRTDIETVTIADAEFDSAETLWVAGPHTEYSEALADAYEDGGTAAVAEMEKANGWPVAPRSDFECCTTDEHGIVTSDGPDAPAGHFMAAHSVDGDRPWTLMHDPNTGHYSYGIEDGYR